MDYDVKSQLTSRPAPHITWKRIDDGKTLLDNVHNYDNNMKNGKNNENNNNKLNNIGNIKTEAASTQLLSNATDDILFIPIVTAGMNGWYECRGKNEVGEVTGVTFKVNVLGR